MSNIPTTINNSDVAGKYNFIKFTNDKIRPNICRANFENNNTLHIGPCILDSNCSNPTSHDLKWRVENNKMIKIYDDNNYTNVIGYLYKGKNRRVAIFDIRKIDNNSSSKMGIAIAVSGDNNLTEAEIGNYTYTYMDVSSNTVDFGRSTINGTNFIWEDLDTTTGNREDVNFHTVVINKMFFVINKFIKRFSKS